MSTLPRAASVDSGREQPPRRAVSGRQTLGSNHDGPQPEPAATDSDNAGLQPVTSTRPVWWHVFKDRCATLEGESGRTAKRLIHHLETGWAHVTQLQLACERQCSGPHARARGCVPHLIRFVEVEVVGTFAACAEGAAAFLPQSGKQGTISVDELGHIAGEFERAIAVSALAIEAETVPDDYRSLVLPAAEALFDWSADFCTLIYAASVLR
jgi:hypothetical protein